MKQKFANALSLALIMAMLFTSVGLADNVQNDVVAGGNDTITAGGSTTISYRITANSGDGQTGCNAADSSPATVTINTPSGVTVDTSGAPGNQVTLTFTSCGTDQSATFSSSTVGNYPITVSVSDSGVGTYNVNPAAFTLKVNAPPVQNQAINVTQAAPASAVYGSSFNVAATGGGSGNPVVITSSGACTGGGDNSASITMTSGTGTCTVFYNQAGATGYNAAPQVSSNTAAQKASADIDVNGYSVTYDGLSHTATGSATGALGEDLSPLLDLSGTTHTDAGTYNADVWSFAGDANHNSANGTVDDSIGQAAVTATAGGGSATYNGGTHSPSACAVSGPYTGDLTCVNDPLSVGPDAGTYPIAPVVSGTGLSNFAVTPVNGSFTIDKAATTTTVTCAAGPFTYNGSAHAPCSATVTGPGGLDETLSVTYSDNVNAGTVTASASYEENGNYLGSSDSKTFVIGKAATATTVTCAAGPFVFNGSAHTPCSASVTGPGGLNQSLAVGYSNNVNAGQATASASYEESANYLGSSDSENFTIDKATSTTTVVCEDGPFTYNGAAHTPCLASFSTSDGLSGSLTVEYSDNINAGTATASASYAGDDNHESSIDSETFTIDKAPTTTLVTCDAGPFVYNGSAHTPCSATVTGAGGLDESLVVSYTNNVNAGTATASASYAESANHLGSSDSETFTIDKAPSITTVSCPTNVTYTGSPLEPCSASVTGAGDLDETLTVSYSDNVNAGTATASASYAGDDNHLSSSDSVNFTIDKAPSATTVTCEAGPFVYNGSAFEPCSASVTGAGGLSETLPVGYSNNINAGTATASASYAGDENHLGSNDSETFTIDKAPSVTTVTCAAGPFYFTGSAIEPCSASVTGAGGLSQSLAVSYSNNVNPGTATASASYAGDANHEASSDSKNFTINSWTLMGFYQPVDMNGVFNLVKGGSTVPLKFEVFAGSFELTDISAVKSLTYAQVSCSGGALTDEIETVATGGTSLRYDTTSGQFIYNWKTPTTKLCYRVTMTTQDGSSLVAYFKLK